MASVASTAFYPEVIDPPPAARLPPAETVPVFVCDGGFDGKAGEPGWRGMEWSGVASVLGMVFGLVKAIRLQLTIALNFHHESIF